VKRVVVGRRVPSHRLEHTLLPKILALPVFSSDALSSVIYAPEEIMRVLLIASAGAAALALPIAGAVALLMAIVVASYRQTIKAYPSGGGAYIVSKDNLGVAPGLIAAAALLVDYVLTVSVSIVAGVQAIITLRPQALLPWNVEMSIFFIFVIMLINLRGAKESGTLFAVPVYMFIASILVMVTVGMFDCAKGSCPSAAGQPITPDPHLATAVASVGLFTILRAFSSGSAALTGVEAISNGVPAFKRPQSKNAAETLVIMGAIAITMFMGIAFLASRAHVTISQDSSVVGQIANAVFSGGAGFYIVQFFSAAILILAANTSFQDFPRLSAILAKDNYMPRQFINRGDRLVFSNGVLVLAFFASVLVVAFGGNLNRLIQLYVIGVFTSFTLSQSGMIKHWLKEKHKGAEAEKGWKRSIIFNAVGAVTTFVVLIVVTISKFAEGAWISILCMAILALIFPVVHRHYMSLYAALRKRGVRPSAQLATNKVVLLVHDFDDALGEAIGYIHSFRPPEVHPVWIGKGRPPADVRERWNELVVGGGPELEFLERHGSLVSSVRHYLGTIPRGRRDFITVVVPETVRTRVSIYALTRLSLVRVKAGLLREHNVVVTDVPVPVGLDGAAVPEAEGKPMIPKRVSAFLFVSSVNDATMWAVNYVRTLQATQLRAIHFSLEPEATGKVLDDWVNAGAPIPLEIVEAPFRDLRAPMLELVRAETSRGDTLAAVVAPEYVVKKRHWVLHNQSALFVKRLFLNEPRVILTSVPWSVDM
jgi:amino acid transporter